MANPLRVVAWVSFALSAASCAPSGSSHTLMALLDPGNGTLTPTPIQLQTITDPTGMVGTVAHYSGGARIVVDNADPYFYYGTVADNKLDEVFVKEKGGSVHANYLEKDGVLWPSDFHSWNLTTSYFHFEQAWNYFQELGVSPSELGTAPVYYFPDYVLAASSLSPQKDNAFFFAPVHGFLLLPFDQLQQVPLALNEGVLFHEYSHLVFSSRVYQSAAVPDAFRTWGPQGIARPSNILKSLDEGLADYLAYGATCETASGCDPKFLASSLPDNLASARDMSLSTQCLTTEQVLLISQLSSDAFLGQARHYQVGSALAASLYQAGEKTSQRGVLLAAILLAYTDPLPATPGLHEEVENALYNPANFTMESAVNAILSHIGDADLQKELCSQMLGRLKIDRDYVPACPVQSYPVSDCSQVL